MKIPDTLIIILSCIFLGYLFLLIWGMIKDWVIHRWFNDLNYDKEDYPIFYDEDNNNKNE